MYRIAGSDPTVNWPCSNGAASCSGDQAKLSCSVTVPLAGKTLYSGLTSGNYGGSTYLWLAEVGKGAIRQILLAGDLRACFHFIYVFIIIFCTV